VGSSDLDVFMTAAGVLIGVPLVLFLIGQRLLEKARAKAKEHRLNAGTSLGDLKRLETLASLRDNGAITNAEFEAEKSKILRSA
jgi:hypothetical protein